MIILEGLENDSPVFYLIGTILAFTISLSAIFTTLDYEKLQKTSPKQGIITQFTDNRGLTSVIFIKIDTVGLDYLTPQELDSLKLTLKH